MAKKKIEFENLSSSATSEYLRDVDEILSEEAEISKLDGASREKPYVSAHTSRAIRRSLNRKHKLEERGPKGVTLPKCRREKETWVSVSKKDTDALKGAVLYTFGQETRAYPRKEVMRAKHEVRIGNEVPEYHRRRDFDRVNDALSEMKKPPVEDDFYEKTLARLNEIQARRENISDDITALAAEQKALDDEASFLWQELVKRF